MRGQARTLQHVLRHQVGEVKTLPHANSVMRSTACLLVQTAVCASASGTLCCDDNAAELSDGERPKLNPGFVAFAGISACLFGCDAAVSAVSFACMWQIWSCANVPASISDERVQALKETKNEAKAKVTEGEWQAWKGGADRALQLLKKTNPDISLDKPNQKLSKGATPATDADKALLEHNGKHLKVKLQDGTATEVTETEALDLFNFAFAREDKEFLKELLKPSAAAIKKTMQKKETSWVAMEGASMRWDGKQMTMRDTKLEFDANGVLSSVVDWQSGSL